MKPPSVGQVLNYLIWFLLGLAFFLIAKFLPGLFNNPLVFSLAFFYLLFLPGWLLFKLLQIKIDDLVGRILSYFALGLSFLLVLILAGIFTGLSLSLLIEIDVTMLILLFIGSLVWTFINPSRDTWKRKITWDDLFFILPLLLGLFILYIVYLKGPGLDGDPYLHLSIVRKAFLGDSLASRALAFTKTSTINPAYAYPVWHVFLAMISKITSLDPLATWSYVLIPLSAISMLTWYWLAKKIFVQKCWAILSLLLFMIVTFYTGTGYLFTRLVVPDTLSQFIILPLIIAFALEFIFGQTKSKNVLIIVALLSLVSLVIHGPHYFYFLLIFLVYGLFFVLLSYKTLDYKITLIKIGQIILAALIPLVIFGLAIEVQSRSLSSVLAEFSKVPMPSLKTQFSRFGLMTRYGYLLLPIVFLFVRQKRSLFIIAIMSLVPIIYWTPLGNILGKYLSFVFIERLADNTALYFLVFAFVLGFKVFIFDYWSSRLAVYCRHILEILLAVLIVVLIIFEVQTQKITVFSYLILYSKSTSAFVNHNIIWFLVATIILAVASLVIWKLIYKKRIIIEALVYQNRLIDFLLIFLISFFFFAPSLEYLRVFLPQPVKIEGEQYFLKRLNNDQKALNFVENDLPSKSVFLADADASRALSVFTDNYLAYNVGSAYEEKFDWVFASDTPDWAKADIVLNPKWAIDYVYLEDPSLQNSHFKAHPEIYEKIYSGQTEVYKIIK